MARILMERIDLQNWGNYESMPRTRDLSASRRTLLQAWCRKILQAGG
jgi:hypothetical protein